MNETHTMVVTKPTNTHGEWSVQIIRKPDGSREVVTRTVVNSSSKPTLETAPAVSDPFPTSKLTCRDCGWNFTDVPGQGFKHYCSPSKETVSPSLTVEPVCPCAFCNAHRWFVKTGDTRHLEIPFKILTKSKQQFETDEHSEWRAAQLSSPVLPTAVQTPSTAITVEMVEKNIKIPASAFGNRIDLQLTPEQYEIYYAASFKELYLEQKFQEWKKNNESN
jgi:hypothetical protein